MTKTLLLWRHGQTDYNLHYKVQGQVDIPLNATGRQQARAAAELLIKLPISRIVSSPLGRAMETAKCVADRLGLEIALDERLKERDFGLWEGLTAEEIQAGWPHDFTSWRDWGDPNFDTTQVEPRKDTGVRVAAALRSQAEAMNEGETALVVTHGSASVQGIVELLALDPSNWYGLHGLDNCHWACVETSRRAPGWALRAYNLGAADTRLI